MANIEIYIPEEKDSLKGITRARFKGKYLNAFRLFRDKIKDFPLTDTDKNEIGINNNAVYILLGEDEDNNTKYYIGQSYDIINRIINHSTSKEKDFFQEIILFTSSEFSPTSIFDLESMMINKAKENNINISNSKNEKEQNVDIAIKEENRMYFKEIKTLCNIFGLYIFDDNITKQEEKEKESKGEVFYCKGNYADARGFYRNGGMIVLEGSRFSLKEVGSFPDFNKTIKNRMIQNGDLLEKDNNSYILTKNYYFKSPSSASSIILGIPSNGWNYWKNKEGKTLSDIYRPQ